MRFWDLTTLTHDGGLIWRNRLTGDIAWEALSEPRLVELPADVEADLRRRLELDTLKETR